ncbi:uncharacterized protein [Coffea arabica]
MSCVPTGISNSSSNFWKRKGYPSSGTLVFRESGIGSSLGGMKGHKIIVEKNGMHSKFGTRKGKKGEEPLHQIKRKALDGRRFKELWKNRAKTANASDLVLEERNELFQQDGRVAGANSLNKIGKAIVEKPHSSCDGKRMVSHETQETCSCDVIQGPDTLGVTFVSNTLDELNWESTNNQDHALRSDSQQDVKIKSEDKSCVICGNGGKLLCCVGQGCGRRFHLSCVNPPFTYFPHGVWHCIWCVKRKMEMGVRTVSEGIESILDVECVSANAAMQKQYLVKYKGLAHVHNCWIPEEKLLLEAPALIERHKKKNQKLSWKPEWSEPQRLLAKRLLLFPRESCGTLHEDDHCQYEWLVKWTGLGYDQATWELENAPFLRTPEVMKLKSDFAIRHEREKVEMHHAKEDKRRKISLSELPELPFGGPDNLIYVNKLREGLQRNLNALVIDPQERVVKVVLFVLSLLKETSGPFLIITTSTSLSMWEAEFQHWASNVNLLVYKGSGDIRGMIRDLEFYNQGGSIMFQVLLSPSVTVVEDLENLKPIKWEVIAVDECQRPTMSVHLEQIKDLAANMRLLLVSSQIKDRRFNYFDVLSLLDPLYDGASKNCLGADISKLKKRLGSFVAYECKHEQVKFMEFWVPAMLTEVQSELYCASLYSNSVVLCSRLRSDTHISIHDLLETTRKCCDHPYLVDRSLRNSVLQDKPASDHFDVEIQMSGKLQLLDKILPEIKRRGLRVLLLFQEIVGSGKISIGDILDDFIHQKFGTDSYARIDVEISRSKKRAAFNMFNNKDNGNFLCLIEARACLPSTKLSSVDTIIIFNSDWDPVNDLKALQKITLDSQFEQLKIFRLYSAYTVEEKALILAKEGATLDSSINNIKQSICQKLLAWGAPRLFSKLDSNHEISASSKPFDSFEQTLSEDVLQELSALLPCNSTEQGSTFFSGRKNNSKYVLMVEEFEGTDHGKDLSLIGELKTHSVDTFPASRQLGEDESPDIFWTNLLEARKPRWKYMSGPLQRKRKVTPFACLSKQTEYKGEASKKGRTDAKLKPTPNEKPMFERRLPGGDKKKRFAGNSPNSAVKEYRHVHKRRVQVEHGKEAAVSSRDHGRKIYSCGETATACDVGMPDHSEVPVTANSIPPEHEEGEFLESRESHNDSRNLVNAFGYQVQATIQTTTEGSTWSLADAVPQLVRNLQLQPVMTPIDRTEPDAANLEEENFCPDLSSNHPTEASSGTSEGPQPACVDSLQREMERIQLAREHAIKIHEDMKLQLEAECEKELEEIRKKYDLLIHNSEVVLAQKRTFLDSCYQIACTQKLLAEVMILNEDGFPASQSQGRQEVTLATFVSDIYQSCFRQPSCRTMSGPCALGNPTPPVVSNLLAVQQAAARNTAIPEPNSIETQTSNLVGQQTAAHTTQRSEISSSNLPVPTPPSQTSAMEVMAHSSAISQTGTNAAYSPSSTCLAMTGSSETLTGPYHPSVLSTSHCRPPSISNIRLSGNLNAGREVRAPAPHLRHAICSPEVVHLISRPC